MSVAALLSPHQAYQRWARSYDSTPNPLLSLEKRCLLPELKKLSGKDVIDLGCGTGRWLQRLEEMSAASVTGVDMSEAMLAEAEKKVSPHTLLLHADCVATPLPSRSADCVLVSFVLSYVRDLGEFAREAARITRFGGKVLISDMHPHAITYGWRRIFKASGSSFEIETFPYTLSELVDAMAQAECRLEEIAEPCFGEEESHIFRQAGHWNEFLKVESLPVIYWARFSVARK